MELETHPTPRIEPLTTRWASQAASLLFVAWMASFGRQMLAQEGPFDMWGQTHGLMGYSVAVALEDGETQTFVGGWRDWERQLPMEASTVFRVASISKAVTAIGFFVLWSEGMIGLDDDINDHLNLDHQIVQKLVAHAGVCTHDGLVHFV